MNLNMATAKKMFRKVLHADGDPKSIGRAAGVGLFVAWFPIFGTHTLLALGLSWAFRLNTAVVFAGTFVNNPITMIPMFLSGFWLGLLLMGVTDVTVDFNMDIETLLELTEKFFIPFCVGNTLLGIVSSVIAYFFTVYAVTRYRAKRDKRLAEELKLVKEETGRND